MAILNMSGKTATNPVPEPVPMIPRATTVSHNTLHIIDCTYHVGFSFLGGRSGGSGGRVREGRKQKEHSFSHTRLELISCHNNACVNISPKITANFFDLPRNL